MRKLKKLGATGIKKTADNLAVKAESRMKKESPIDTGRLRRNINFTIKHKLFNDEIIFDSEAKDPHSQVDYAPIQEFGGRFTKAQPYFFKNIRRFFNNFTTDLDNKVEKIFRSKI